MVWGKGRELRWSCFLKTGQCAPMWSQPVYQHQALSEPQSARTVEINWCMPCAYLPLGCWWANLKNICTCTTGWLHYLNLNSSTVFVQGVDENKDEFLKYSVLCISPNIWHPKSHPPLWNLSDTLICVVTWPSPGDTPTPTPASPRPQDNIQTSSWKAE